MDAREKARLGEGIEEKARANVCLHIEPVEVGTFALTMGGLGADVQPKTIGQGKLVLGSAPNEQAEARRGKVRLVSLERQPLDHDGALVRRAADDGVRH